MIQEENSFIQKVGKEFLIGMNMISNVLSTKAG